MFKNGWRKRSFYLILCLVMSVTLFVTGCSSEQFSSADEADKYTVSGRVVDSDGNGLSGVKLKFTGSSKDFGTAVSGDNGKWSKSGLSGKVKITAISNQKDISFTSKTVTNHRSNLTISQNVIPATTKVLGKNLNKDNLTKVEADALYFKQQTEKIKDLAAGDVIVAGVTELTPEGLIRKVESIQPRDNKVKVNTSSANLSDAIEDGQMQMRKDLKTSSIQSSTTHVQGVRLKSSGEKEGWFVIFDNMLLYDGDGDESTKKDQIRINGSMDFDYDVNFSASIDDGELENLVFKNVLDQEQNFEVKINSKVKSHLPYARLFSKTLKEFDLKPITFYVGPVPVVLKPELSIDVGLDGDLHCKLDTSVQRTSTITAGIAYRNGNWEKIGDVNNSFSWDRPEFTTGGFLRAWTGPFLTTKLYGVAGPCAKFNIFAKYESTPDKVPSWKIYGGLEVLVGGQIEVLDAKALTAIRKVLEYKKVLAKAEETELSIAYPDPLVAGKEVTFRGEAPANAHKVIASVDSWPLTDNNTGSEDIIVQDNGEYKFDYTFSQASRDRRLVINAFDRNGNSLEQVERTIDVYEKGHLKINCIISNRKIEITGWALPPINKVRISVDGYPLTDSEGNKYTVVGDDNKFKFTYEFSQAGEDRKLVVNAFDELGNSVNQVEKTITVE